MKQLAAPFLILLALAALAIWGVRQQTPSAESIEIRCAHPVDGCTFMHRGTPAQLRFSVPPESLKPFEISLALPNIQKASASFQMADMNMGFNRYDFKSQSNNAWKATVTLPVCTSSRVDWIAEFDIDGQHYRLSFETH